MPPYHTLCNSMTHEHFTARWAQAGHLIMNFKQDPGVVPVSHGQPKEDTGQINAHRNTY